MTEPSNSTTSEPKEEATNAEILPGVPYEEKTMTEEENNGPLSASSIEKRAASAKQEQKEYLKKVEAETNDGDSAATIATTTTTSKLSPSSPVSSLGIMERAAQAKEKQQHYLEEKKNESKEEGGDGVGGGTTSSEGEPPKTRLPPPPPSGNWGKTGPPPKNETAKQKRDRQRREQDAARLRQSSKFGQKRAVTPNRNKRPHGETKEERDEKRRLMLEAKKKRAMARFTPAQQKLLKRGKESRDYWIEYAKKRPNTAARESEKLKIKLEQEKKEEKKRNNDKTNVLKKGTMSDIWHACESGDVKYIKNHVQHSKWDVRRHHDRGINGFGGTPLHKACFGSHVNLVKWLIEHVERRYGKDELKKYINCIDSHASQMTPLLEACRTKVGYMEDRLIVLKLLLKNGANLRLKDIHGDNCLHWAARTGSLPVVRYLLKNTEGAVWAAMDENILRKRPIDIALEQCCEKVNVLNKDEASNTASVRLKNVSSEEPPIVVQLEDLFPLPLNRDSSTMLLATHKVYARDAVYGQLLKLVQGSNVRLKIQRNRERRENDKIRRKQKLQDERDAIVELARSTAMDAEAEWIRQREGATIVRQNMEDAYVQSMVNKEIEDATKFLDSTEGKREYKKRATEIQNRRKELALSKGEPKPKRLPAKEANELAKKELIRERADDVRKQSIRDFRRKNTHKFEKREKKALEEASKKASTRRLRVLEELEQRLKDDIDVQTGLCSEPHLNLNKFCSSYTGW